MPVLTAVTTDLFELLRCSACGGTLERPRGRECAAGPLTCTRCARGVPVVDGVARFVEAPADETARRTQESFGYEWTHFTDWQPSGLRNFSDYFAGVDLASLRDAIVLDAGCGMGRHARQMAGHAAGVVALDFSQAIDQARRNVDGLHNVICVQGDLFALPLAEESFDYVYSLGVLHHLAETEQALAALARRVRPGGRLRVYLYWTHGGWKGRVLRVVAAARRVTTRLPFGLLRAGCFALSVALFAGIVLPYRALTALGVRRHRHWPLFVYSRYPFAVLYNDQFDRFSAPIEKRYTREEVAHLLEGAGLVDVTVRPCFGWVGEGTKPWRR